MLDSPLPTSAHPCQGAFILLVAQKASARITCVWNGVFDAVAEGNLNKQGKEKLKNKSRSTCL